MQLAYASTLRLIMLAMSLATVDSARSAEKQADLPGVKGDYRIVKPSAPEPEAEDAQPSALPADGWDVTISGTFTVDIGAGTLPLPRN